MKTVIVLAMHGAPPRQVPQREVVELVAMHQAMEHGPAFVRALLEKRYRGLDSKIRAWPRTAENDPFWAGSQELAEHVRAVTGSEVVVGFNEFCAPTLDDALDQAAVCADQVVVVTPMMTRGGEHSEADIPDSITRAQARHPAVTFKYAWPMDVAEIAQFLAQQVARLS